VLPTRPVMPRYFLKTYGCQMNMAESQRLRCLLASAGWEEAAVPGEADVVVVNTCSVRQHAEDRAMGFLRSCVRKRGRTPFLCLYGCMAGVHGASLFDQFPFLSGVCAPAQWARLPRLLDEMASGRKVLALGDSDNRFSPLPCANGSVSVSVPITSGCSNRCAYCIVPAARGPLRSRPMREILSEIEHLSANGAKEAVLLGQNVNEYGGGGRAFVSLLEAVHEIPGILRIRFLTSHPKDMPPELLHAWRRLPKLVRHLHLPLQSASDRVLAHMRRGYTRQQYLDIVREFRALVPDGMLTSDLITGFPGETEGDFEETRQMVADGMFDDLFVFAYSPRPGTAAAQLPDDVPPEEKRRRHRELLCLQDSISLRKNRATVGSRRIVLVQRTAVTMPGHLKAHGLDGRTVLVRGDAQLIGKLVAVRITGAGRHYLEGEPQTHSLCGSVTPQ